MNIVGSIRIAREDRKARSLYSYDHSCAQSTVPNATNPQPSVLLVSEDRGLRASLFYALSAEGIGVQFFQTCHSSVNSCVIRSRFNVVAVDNEKHELGLRAVLGLSEVVRAVNPTTRVIGLADSLRCVSPDLLATFRQNGIKLLGLNDGTFFNRFNVIVRKTTKEFTKMPTAHVSQLASM